MIITRKAALHKAIEILSAQNGTNEIITKLTELADELPLIHWTDRSINDTVMQFIMDYGRTPTVSDFRRKGMPPHTVIKQKYGITLAKWLYENYPTEKPDATAKPLVETKSFIAEYKRLKPQTAADFNARRTKSKSWQTVAHYNGVKSWGALLDTLHLKHYVKNQVHKPRKFNITVHTDSEILNQHIHSSTAKYE